MFIDKNKYKYDMIPRVVAASKMLNWHSAFFSCDII